MTRWSYDEAGNITEQVRVTDAGTETDTRTYNNLNQLTTSSGGWTYQYDLDGNLTEKNNGDTEDCEKWEYAWNENSRLMQVKKGVYDATPVLVNEFTVGYQYDEMGRMLRRDDGTDVTDYFYDGWDIWKEVTGESVTEYLVPGLGICSFLRDGELFTLQTDGLGSVRAVTDSGGAAVARLELDAWGETLPGSVDLVPGGLPLGFAGAVGVRKDPVSGLIWMRHRWYEPQLARFVSRDPIGLGGGVNLYRYASSDPSNSIDPFGLKPCPSMNQRDLEFNRLLRSGTPILMSADTHYTIDPKTGWGHIYTPGEWASIQANNDAALRPIRMWASVQTGLWAYGGGVFITPGAASSAAYGAMPKPVQRGVVVDTNIVENYIIYGRDNLAGNQYPVLPRQAIREFLRVPGRSFGQLRQYLQDFGGRVGRVGDASALQKQIESNGGSLPIDDCKIGASSIREGMPLMTADKRFHRNMRSLGYPSHRFNPANPRYNLPPGEVIDEPDSKGRYR